MSEFTPEIKGEGIRKMSVLIEHSFRTKSVYFELYENLGEWFLYWNFETPIDVILQEAIGKSNPKLTMSDVLKNENFQKEIRQLSEVSRCILTNEDVLLVKQLLVERLPRIDKKPIGLDGHSYTIKIYELDEEYHCWCVLPDEWISLKPLIEMIVEKAELSESYLTLE